MAFWQSFHICKKEEMKYKNTIKQYKNDKI